jgi:phosphopantetheinyl transferase
LILFTRDDIPCLPEGVHLALQTIEKSNKEESTGQDLLSDIEREELNKLNHPERREEFLTGRKLFRDMVHKLGWDESKAGTRKDDMGRPWGEVNGERVWLSFSHTGRYMLCALSWKRAIGVDIESAGRKLSEEIEQRMLAEGESVRISSIQIWTIKEAALKLKGTGLRSGLKNVKIISENSPGKLRFSDDSSCEFCTFEHEDHYISLAY